MIRQYSLLVLLACTSLSFAQPLYKWAEADGSITFSPNRPPAGTPFETIQQANGAPVESTKTALPKTAAAKAVTDKTLPAPLARQTGIDRVESISARRPSSDETAQRIVAADVDQSTARANLDSTQITDNQRIASIAANNKQSRCQDLQKRVVSLERRLKSRLTPEDMDNTVVHMARYQRSFDQHCEQ